MALAVAVRDELRDETLPARPMPRRWRSASSIPRCAMPPAYGGAGARLQGRVHLLLPQRGDGDRARGLPRRRRAARAARCQASSPGSPAGAMPCRHRRIRRSPCPLLHDDLCSVYAARPEVCRKHNSFSVGACIADYEGRRGNIPIRRFDQEIFECCAVALLVGMRLWDGRQGAVFELSGALARRLARSASRAAMARRRGRVRRRSEPIEAHRHRRARRIPVGPVCRADTACVPTRAWRRPPARFAG